MKAEDFRIAPLDEKSREQYMDLCQYCFGMADTDRERYFTEAEELSHSLGAFDGDRLASAMFYFAFEMRVRGAFIPMGGIAAVATWPEYRNYGLVRRLIMALQEIMRTEQRPLSVLQPFKHSYYENMGWANTFDVYQPAFEPDKIRFLPDEGYTVRQVHGPYEWETFEKLQLEFGERYNGTVRRSQSYWERRYFNSSDKKKRNAYLVLKGDGARGFFLGRRMEPDKPGLGPDYGVLQMVWLDPGALRAIFRFFRSHRDQMRKVKLNLPPDIRLFHLFSNAYFESKLDPKMMTKVVDVKMALERLPYAAELSGQVNLEVDGESTAPWNTDTYEIKFAKGKAQVMPERPFDGAARVSIQGLSEMFMGYRSASELVGDGVLTASPEQLELLEAAFPRHLTYIDDWF
jgi:predicted acetyltransferase